MFGQNRNFWPKKLNLGQNQNFSQKMNVWPKNEILAKK